MIRCFFCLEPDHSVRKNIWEWIQRKRRSAPDLKWVKWENLHITLKFCGEIVPDLRDDLMVKIGPALQKWKGTSFEMSLGGVGVFPGTKRPRVLWTAPLTGQSEIIDLQGMIEKECAGSGLALERRPFSPHLTLARVGRGSGGGNFFLDLLNDRPCFGSSRIKVLTFMESILGPKGPVYTPIFRYDLENTSVETL